MVFDLRRTVLVFLLVFFAAGVVVPSAVARSSKKTRAAIKPSHRKSYTVSARSAVLIEARGWRRVYTKDLNRKILPASTTKVLTASLVLERLRLDDYVTISARAARVLPSKLFAQEGDRYTVRDLLYASLLNSANDATIALAEAAGGTEEKFVRMMNARAAWIGARSSLFANSHGLPDDEPQYSTANDMTIILREALKKPFFREIMQTKFRKIVSQRGKVTVLRSHNKMLFKGWKRMVYGKTGYTQAARACFLGYFEKNKKIWIVAVFGCSQRWDDIKHLIEHYGGVDL